MPNSALSSSIEKPKPWGLWATLGFSILIFGVFVLTQTVIFLVALSIKVAQSQLSAQALAGDLASNGFMLAIATLVTNPICIALILFLVRLHKKLPIKSYLSLKHPTRRQLLEWCLVMVLCVVAIDLLKSLADQPIVPEFVVDVYQTAYLLPLFYLAVVVMAPVFEELFFRGFMFQGLKYSPVGKVGAVLLPALFWSLMHLQYNWLDVSSLFVVGIVLGIAQLQTGSIYVPLAMHALNNLMSIVQVALQVHTNLS